MPGFIDPNAPDVATEYSRFIDGDILGKMIFKNFLLNRVGIAPEAIIMPRGRHGDVEADEVLPADARLLLLQREVDIEVKCARINVANRSRGSSNENYAFYGFLNTRDTKDDRSYDIAVAICVRVLGIEEPGYWDHLTEHQEQLTRHGHQFSVTTMPHEPEFLNICGFFIVPRSQIQSNQWRVTISGNSSRCPYWGHFAWGYDVAACTKRWDEAILSQPHTD